MKMEFIPLKLPHKCIILHYLISILTTIWMKMASLKSTQLPLHSTHVIKSQYVEEMKSTSFRVGGGGKSACRRAGVLCTIWRHSHGPTRTIQCFDQGLMKCIIAKRGFALRPGVESSFGYADNVNGCRLVVQCCHERNTRLMLSQRRYLWL
jgi:hypothetical protein